MTNHQSAVPTPEFLLQHASWAHSLARSLVGESAAEDLVQDTWVAALKAKPSMDRPLRPWLGTVLGNLSRQRSRGASRRLARETEAIRSGFEPSAADLTEQAESQKLLMEQLLKLDEGLREVLLLKYFEGLSAAEIGRRKGLAASTVKTRLQRGLDEMRASLESHFDGDRNAWSFALLPLLRVDQAKRAGAVAASGSFGLKLVAQVILWVVTGTLGVVTLVSLIGNLPFFEDTVPIEKVTFKPLEPSLYSVALVDARESLRKPVTSPNFVAEVPLDSPVEPDATLLKVRFLDEMGNPVSGVRMRSKWSRNESKAASDLYGRLEFLCPATGGASDSVVYFHPSLASDALSYTALPGETLHLGDVTVNRGGAVSGVVVDGFGNPLVAAQVYVHGAEILKSVGTGMTSSTWSSLGEAEDKTNARGEFRLEGVLAGNVRVKVNAKRGLHTAESGWVPIRAGDESQGLVIVAAELPSEQRLEGHVVDPEGHPVVGASVDARFKTFFRSGSIGTTTDRNGFFRIIVAKQTGHDLDIRGPSNGNWSPIFMEGVQPGQVDMRIQFEAVDFFTLLVVDAEGNLLKDSSCSVFDGNDKQGLQWAHESKGSIGTIELRVPKQSAVLRVLAPGHGEERVHVTQGKVVAGCDFTVTLSILPGVTGRLMLAGKPVAGAHVYLQRKANGKSKFNGFPVRFDGQSETSATSKADGTFYLDARKSGQYVVRATSAGLAPAESALFQLSPEFGRADVELELSSGGSIEGALKLAGDANPAGSFVAISRGDCWARTIRVREHGTFRFDNLIPGNWMIKLVDHAIDDSSSTSHNSSSFFAEVSIPSNCVVQEGGVTRHDLMSEPLSGCVLRGQLDIQGLDLTTWNGSLDPETLEDGSEGGIHRGFTMDAAGYFEVRVQGAGKWKLSFHRPGDSGLNFMVPLELEKGLNQWSASVPMGTVTLTGKLHEPCIYFWKGPNDLIATISLIGNKINPLDLRSVPAGPTKLLRLMDVHELDPRGPLPPAWLEFQVPEGANQEVLLPR